MMKIKGNKVGFAVFFVFSVAVMILIFMFSFQAAEQSSQTSMSLYSLFINFTGFDFVTHSIFRKIAHFSEFAALGFFLCGSAYFFYAKRKILLPLIITVLYAVSDEIHQLFVPQRACSFVDVLIDSAGGFTGILVFLLFVSVITKISIKGRSHF